MQATYTILSERPVEVFIPEALVEDRLDAEFYQPVYLRAVETLESAHFPLKPLQKLSSKKSRVYWGIKGLDESPSSTHIPYIRPNEADDDGWIEYENLTTIERHWADDMPSAIVQPGDLLVEVKGNARKVHVVREDVPPLTFVSGSMYRFVPRSDVDVYYLWAYLTSPICQTLKDRLMSNSIIKWINPEDICQMPVPEPLPPLQTYIGAKVRLAEQCRTHARQLWSDSKKILAEAMSLSVEADFWEKVDPVELHSPVYNLVSVEPSAMWIAPKLVEREIGAQNFHPRRANVVLKLQASGVELKSLSSLASRKTNRVSAAQLHTIPYYIGLAEIDSTTGYFDPVAIKETEVTGISALFQANDVLYSKLRPYLNKVSICPPHVQKACGSTELLVYRIHQPFLPYYIFFVLKSSLVLYQIIDVTAGSTLPRVDPELVDDILVPLISPEKQQLIDDNVRRVFLLRHRATQLIREAKADVEALIEGRLDVAGILAEQVRPPTWDDVRQELALTGPVSKTP